MKRIDLYAGSLYDRQAGDPGRSHRDGRIGPRLGRFDAAPLRPAHAVGVHGKNARFPERAPTASVLDKAIDAGVKRGLKALVLQLKGEVAELKPLIDSGFGPQAMRARRL